MILPIIPFTDEMMNTKTKKIFKVNDFIKSMAQNMIDTMIDADGIGIAAPQVGIAMNMAIIDTTEGPLCVINPEIVFESGETHREEGCLSASGFSREIKRAWQVRITYLGLDNKNHTKTFNGIEAICAQHEIDHLKGITIITKK